MEAIAGANRGGVAGYSACLRESVPAMSGRQNLVLPGRNYYVGSRRGGLQTVCRSLFSSDSFEDQSHLRFYINNRNSGRKEKLANSVVREAVVRLEGAVDFGAWNDAERNFDNKGVMKAKKKQMKMQKKLKKSARAVAGVSSSSSSSSSSESEAGATLRRSRTRRPDMEKLRRDWDCILQSPLMNYVPTISSNFVIEHPQAQQQLVSPMESSCAAREAEGTSATVVSQVLNSVMAMRISSRVGTDPSVGANGQYLPISMAGVIVPRQPSTVAARVEVCMGGKCKKAGAEEVLSAFQANGVTASACNKCMKKCKLAVNVRVHQDDDDVPQMYSGIEVEDVKTLSQKHLGAYAGSRAPSFGAL